MRRAGLVILALGFAVAPCGRADTLAQEPVVQKELEKLQGTWYSLSTESDGKQQTGEDKTDLHIITGNTCVIKLNRRIVGGSTITVEPGERNGRITFHMTAGQYKGKTWVGIYQADGDTLRWCGGWKGEIETLPSAFATKQGDHLFLRTLGRAKP